MTFARVKGRPSPAQRRWLQMMEQLGDVSAMSLRPPTLGKLVELGYARVTCRSCGTLGDATKRDMHHKVTITDRGRKYLANWRRAYGAPDAAA